MGEPFLWCLWLIEGTPESQRVAPALLSKFLSKKETVSREIAGEDDGNKKA